MGRITSFPAIILVALSLIVAGCATVGQDFPTHNVDQIEIGETTRAEIQELFGEPWRTGIEDGKRTWTYGKYRWSAFGDAETTDLVVRFNQDGTVSSYVYNTTE
ncbi:MAG: outer membrane protein assembly factor BamE [Marinobacter sp.]|nr:outer membrane protein assembly factor BamE [Marinobacter sp.]